MTRLSEAAVCVWKSSHLIDCRRACGPNAHHGEKLAENDFFCWAEHGLFSAQALRGRMIEITRARSRIERVPAGGRAAA
jgi:hypothetical protein